LPNGIVPLAALYIQSRNVKASRTGSGHLSR
jgi:hypothetical protein